MAIRKIWGQSAKHTLLAMTSQVRPVLHHNTFRYLTHQG
jgi:hypothetical protein